MLDDTLKIRLSKQQHRRWKAASILQEQELSSWMRDTLDEQSDIVLFSHDEQ